MPYKDKDQQLKYQREWYQKPKNKKKTKERTKIKRSELKKWFRELKLNYPCARCDHAGGVCIDFHHPYEDEKEYNISHLVKNSVSKEKIMNEIEKCIPLCSNCHRKLHSGEINIEHIIYFKDLCNSIQVFS